VGTTTILKDVGGASPIVIFPLTMPPDSTGQGTFTATIDDGSSLNSGYGQSSADSGDNHSWNFYFAKGTYTLRAFCITAANRGILKIQIDGVTVNDSGYDTNIAATYLPDFSTANIEISAGSHTVTLLCDTKTGTGYATYFEMISFERTA